MFRTPLQHNSGRATSLDGNCTCRVGRNQSIFISGQLKVIPLFRIPRFTASLKGMGYRDRVMVRAGARECNTSFFSLLSYKIIMVNIFVFVGSVAFMHN